MRKLYADAELPQILCVPEGPDRLVLTYRSPRRFADLAEGLIKATLAHYGERATLERVDLSEGRGDVVRFTITRIHAE